MNDRGPLCRIDHRERGGHDRIETGRALTAAEDQHAKPTRALGEALRGRRDRRDLAPHRVADALRLRMWRKACGKRFEHAASEASEHAVRHAGDGILFVNHERPTREPRREAAGARHETADRKSTRLNSSHVKISYAVFCLKKITTDQR